MTVVDANVLLYAVNADSDQHEASRIWLDDTLSGEDTACFTWVAMLAFLRLSTSLRLFPRPLTVAGATALLRAWTSAPGGLVVHPGPNHAEHLERMLSVAGGGSNLVNDAQLAPIAVEQRAEVATDDSHFVRFPKSAGTARAT